MNFENDIIEEIETEDEFVLVEDIRNLFGPENQSIFYQEFDYNGYDDGGYY